MLPTSFDSAVDDLSSLVWKMSIGPGGQPSFTGPSGNFAALDEPRETEAVNSLHSIATRREEIDLDDADTREQLFGLFMEHINPYHQFLDNLSVFSSQSTYPLVGLSTEFRTNAVLAAGACYASSDRAALLGQAYATRAEEMMLRCCRDNPSLALVQGLAILTWRELSLGREHTAWVNNCKFLSWSWDGSGRLTKCLYSSGSWNSSAPRSPRHRPCGTLGSNSICNLYELSLTYQVILVFLLDR